MKKIAFIFSLIATISEAIILIPLIWMIPMTIKMYKASKGEAELSLGFKVCTLIFNNLNSGILLLVDKD